MNYPDPLIVSGVERLLADLSTVSARERMAGGKWPQREWDAVEASGFADILGEAPAAGEASGWADAWPLFHGIGRHGLPLPLSETIVAAALLAHAGMDRPAGPLTVATAGPGMSLRRDGRGQLLADGQLPLVPWARHATALVLGGQIDGATVIACIDLRGAGVRVLPGANLAGEPRDTVVLDGCRSMATGTPAAGLARDPVLLFGAAARAAMLAGAAQCALDLAVTHANERSQFGRPIGKFQAIQQQLAEAAGEVAGVITASTVACGEPGAHPAWFDVAVAKVRADGAAGRVAQVAHQVHGAIGFTDEHALHQATKRLWSWRDEFGSGGWWAQALGRAAIARGGNAFWSGLTARQIAPGEAA